MMGELVGFLLIAVVAGGIGITFGILFVAPRLSRFVERRDEEPRDGHD